MDFDKINIDATSYNVKDSTARQQISAARQQISTEITDRKAADTTLSQQISAETTAREQADSQLSQQIGAETTARVQADSQLSQQFADIQTSKIINVKNFGAVGDGAKDDRNAIQSALNQGGYIYFPAGTYKITDKIVPASNTYMFGPGTIYLDSPQTTLVNAVYIYGTAANPVTHVTIDGLQFTSAGNQPGQRTAISVEQPQNITPVCVDYVTIQHVVIKGFNHRAINTFAGAPGDGYNHGYPAIFLFDVRAYNCGEITFCNSGTTIIANRIYSNSPHSTGEQITVDNGCTNSYFENVEVFHSGGGAGAISIDECRNIKFVNVTIYNSSNIPGFRMNCETGNADNCFAANLFVQGGNYGVSMGSSVHDAQLILSGYRGVDIGTKDFAVKGNGVFIVNGAFCEKSTQSDFDGLSGIHVIGGSKLA